MEGLEVNGWKVPGNIAQLQREDETLKPLFVKAKCDKPSNLCNEEYVVMNGVLYVRTSDVMRLIVPSCCRPLCSAPCTHCTMGWPPGPTENICTH